MKVLPTIMAQAKEKSEVFFIELYIFRLVSGNLYFAACDEDIQWFIPGTTTPVLYKSFPIEREDISSSVDGTIDATSVKVANIDDSFTIAMFSGFSFDNKVVDLYTISYPESLTEATAYTWDFSGRIDAPVLDQKERTFQANLNSAMPQGSPGRILMLSCNSDFGDISTCGASLNTQTGTVGLNSDSHNINIEQTMPDGYWRNGEITVGYESRLVEDSIGNKVTIRYPFYNAPTGIYNVSRGCGKTYSDCKEKENLQNFDGYPSIPYELVIR